MHIASLKAPGAKDFDKSLGKVIRRERVRRGLSQQEIADAIGVTYQQFHKYEHGINRVSASRLYDIAKAMGIPAQYFFEEVEEPTAASRTEGQRMCLELARNFAQITDEKQRAALSQLARSLAAAS